MIVDGICIQFFGCFDHGHKTQKQTSDIPTQQISGVGRVELDEEYYRELSSIQVCSKEKRILFVLIEFYFRLHRKLISKKKNLKFIQNQ